MDIVGKIKVRIEGSGGQPVPEATVEVVRGPTAALLQTTDAEGFCTFLTLAPGSYEVQASKAGFETESETTTVRSEEETSLSFRLNAAPDNGQPA